MFSLRSAEDLEDPWTLFLAVLSTVCFLRYPEGLPAGAALSTHHQDTVPCGQGGHDPTARTYPSRGPQHPPSPENCGTAGLSATSREGKIEYYDCSTITAVQDEQENSILNVN